MRTTRVCGIFLLGCVVPLCAQQPTKGLVGAGPDKIYLTLGLELLSKAIPFNDCVAYRIERKQANEKTWKQLTETETTTSKSDFLDKLSDAMKIVPNAFPVGSLPIDKVWKKVEEYRRLDSLKFWGMVLPVRVALGITYVDADARAGITYEYRISKINAAGKVLSQVLSFPVAFPGKADYAPPILVKQDASEKQITLKWKSTGRKRPSSFQCFRQDQLQGDFAPVVPVRSISIMRDTLFLTVSDSLVDPVHIYRYYIVPMDFYGNRGAASDTAMTASYDFNSIPLPDKISASSLDSLGGIQLRWQLPAPGNVKSLKILKSVDWEKGYQQIAELPAHRVSYIDQNVEPMVKYFYAIVMTGMLGEESPASAKVFGVFQSSLAPLRPWILKYAGTAAGVRLAIASPEKKIAGYRIYRGIEGRDMVPITDLLPKRDSVTVFLDSSSTLSGAVQYGYAVRAESGSHRLSDFSDTVFVRPLKSTQPLAPRDLTADPEGSRITLYWTDMQPLDPNLDGYVVYRREIVKQNQAELQKLFERPLAANSNRYVDTAAQEGTVFEYAVQSIDIYGSTSVLSNPVRAGAALHMPVPPEGVRAHSAEEGVVIQWDETFQKDVTGYNVYRYVRGKNPERVASVKQSESACTDKKARKGELYFYYITSIGSTKVESAPSHEVGIRP